MSVRPLLVLDLDETLWHGDFTDKFEPEFEMRPGLAQFLNQVSESWDIGVWTAATPNWAEVGFKALFQDTGFDLKGRSQFVFYRDSLREEMVYDFAPYSRESSHYRIFKHSAKFNEPQFAKYQNKILAIDDYKINYKDDPSKCLILPQWESGPCTELQELAFYLEKIKDQDANSWNHNLWRA